LLIILQFTSSCREDKVKKDRLEVIKSPNSSWYSGNYKEDTLLLNLLSGDTNLYWPPNELCRIIDISIDITGSAYKPKVNYNGNEINLAKYNIYRVAEFLKRNNLFKPGDNITVRIFGNLPNHNNIQQIYSNLMC
jgi:hypothetical protein